MSVENCCSCNGKFTDRYLRHNGKSFHPECFRCKFCYEPIREKNFFSLNDERCCLGCHERNRFQKLDNCTRCGDKITQRKIVFEGKSYHPDCFQCGVCYNPVRDPKIYVHNATQIIHCMACFNKKESHDCFKCYKPTPFNELYFTFEGRYFHQQCFKCKVCSRNLTLSDPFYRSDSDRDPAICESCGDKGFY